MWSRRKLAVETRHHVNERWTAWLVTSSEKAIDPAPVRFISIATQTESRSGCGSLGWISPVCSNRDKRHSSVVSSKWEKRSHADNVMSSTQASFLSFTGGIKNQSKFTIYPRGVASISSGLSFNTGVLSLNVSWKGIETN